MTSAKLLAHAQYMIQSTSKLDLIENTRAYFQLICPYLCQRWKCTITSTTNTYNSHHKFTMLFNSVHSQLLTKIPHMSSFLAAQTRREMML